VKIDPKHVDPFLMVCIIFLVKEFEIDLVLTQRFRFERMLSVLREQWDARKFDSKPRLGKMARKTKEAHPSFILNSTSPKPIARKLQTPLIVSDVRVKAIQEFTKVVDYHDTD